MNLWKNNRHLSITKKLFFLTIAMFLVYLISSMVGQVLFYEKFYIHRKTDVLTKDIESFSKEYTGASGQDSINEIIVQHSNASSAYLLVMDESGNIVHSVSYEMTIQLDSGQLLRISLDGAVRDKAFRNMTFEKGSDITVEYFKQEQMRGDTLYWPNAIATTDDIWKMGESTEHLPFIEDDATANSRGGQKRPKDVIVQEVEQVSGTLVSISMPTDENTKSIADRGESARAAMLWIRNINTSKQMEVGQHIDYIYESDDNGQQYVVVVKKIMVENKPQMIFAVTTLQPVTEAVGVMQTLHIMWFWIACAIVIVVSIIFSRFITEPLVNITRVTDRMKTLDFSQKCHVKSNDELGQLAENINSMSDTLDKTISQLQAANAKLRVDIERERDIEKNRQEFVAAVSHELKTPLAIIRAYSEALEDGVSANKHDRYLSVIVDETKKMDALVLDMLENSKLESGLLKMEKRKHDLCDLTSQIIQRFEKSFDDKQITVVKKFEQDQIFAEFDSVRLEQVTTNFITNAIRHTDVGGTIVICTTCDGMVSVENTGALISDEDIEKIWGRFYKADKSRERALGGTGLGLAIAKNILTLHDAEYGVENTKTGVQFWFRLS